MTDLSRRSFITRSAAGAASLSLVGAAAAKANAAPSIKFDETYDVLVVGAGLSGLAAAVMAAREGAKVYLIEKRAWCGGDALLSEGVFHAWHSKVHDALAVEGSPDLSFESFWSEQCRGVMDDDVMNNVRDNTPESPIYHAYNKRNLEVMKRVAHNTAAAINFMADYGIGFKPFDAQHRFLHCVERNEMSRLTKMMLDELKSRGVKRINGVRAQELLQGSDGGVDGVRIEYVLGGRKGQTLAIGAKKTILATGGFLNNEDMMKRYKHYWSDIPFGWSHIGEGIPDDHTGDGIEMGKRIGASLESMESVPKFYAAGEKGVTIPSWLIFYFDKAYFLSPEGKRLHNEFIGWYTGSVLSLRRKGFKHGFVLFDEETFAGANHDYWHFEECMKTNGLFKADTPEALAAKVGLDPKVLRETIERINRDAAAKNDTEFGRTDHFFRPLKAPFYISAKGYPVRYKTEGGLEVNPDFEVLRSIDDKPIGRLYAVGAGCGSMTTRNCDVLSAGMLAGRTAAKSLKS